MELTIDRGFSYNLSKNYVSIQNEKIKEKERTLYCPLKEIHFTNKLIFGKHYEDVSTADVEQCNWSYRQFGMRQYRNRSNPNRAQPHEVYFSSLT